MEVEGSMNMEYKEFKELVVAKAESMGITEFELYYQGAESVSVKIFRDTVDEFAASKEGGVCFRCIANGKMGYASTEELSAEQAAFIVERAYDNAIVLETEEPVFLAPGGQTYLPLERKTYDLPGTEQLLSTALQTQRELYAAAPAVVDGSSTRAIAESSIIAISNSKGLDVSYDNNLFALMAMAVVEKEGEKANDYCIKTGAMDTLDTKAITREAAQKALNGLDCDVAPTGSYPVVFSPKAVAGLLSVFSSVFSSEAAQKGLSRLAGKEGEAIAAACVTVVDDPFCELSPQPMPFDAEGSPTYKKNVIEAGLLKTLLYNLKTANIAGKQTTGNAAKAGYDASIGLQPFTMYFAPGTLTEEELLEKAGQGVYIHDLQGLHAGASPVTGDFSLQSAGFMIENGKLGKPVKSFTVAGNFYEMLQNITALSDTLEIPDATGKTAFGGPCILVEGLSIAGK